MDHFHNDRKMWWQLFRNGFVEETTTDIVKLFLKSKLMKSTTVRDELNAYALNLSKRFYEKFCSSLSINYRETLLPGIIQPVFDIIDQIVQVDSVAPIGSRRAALLAQTYSHTELRTDTSENQLQHRTSKIGGGYLHSEHTTCFPNVFDDDFITQMIQNATTGAEFLCCHLTTSNVWFTHDLTYTVKTTKVLDHQKPVQYVLYIQEGDNEYAFAISDTEAGRFQEQLINSRHSSGTLGTSAVRQMALLNLDKTIAQNGPGACAIRTFHSDWLNQALFEIALSRGLLTLRKGANGEDLLSKMINKDPNAFEQLWQRIQKQQMIPEPSSGSASKEVLRLIAAAWSSKT